MSSHAFFLFAPKFRELGAGVASELARRGVVEVVDGICTGGNKTLERVKAELGARAGALSVLEELEPEWIASDALAEDLRQMEDKLGPGAVGRIITADRRIGAGFVIGGVSRPNRLKEAALRQGVDFPIRYVCGMFRHLERIFDERKPAFMFLYAHASAVSACLEELCRIKRIPLLGLETARMGGRFVVDQQPLRLLTPVRRAFEANEKPSQELRDEAVAALAAFRSEPEAPQYEAFNRTTRRRQTPGRQFLRAVKTTAGRAKRALLHKERDDLLAARTAWYDFDVARSRRRASRRRFSSGPPPGKRIVFYPLHVDPEASTMVMSPGHTDQLSIVEALAKALPADAVLVVKEHEPMIGMRPRGFYERIAHMPRVVLVGPEKSGTWWVRNSDLTAVITGTAAWEAVRLGKPALVIGNSPFLALGQGMVHEQCLARLPEAMAKAFSLPAVDDEVLIRYIAALLHQSFDFDVGMLWGNYDAFEEADQHLATRRLVDAIEERFRSMAV